MEVAELQARLQATEQELEGARDSARGQEMALAGRQFNGIQIIWVIFWAIFWVISFGPFVAGSRYSS